MPKISELLAIAVQHHQAGRLEAAEKVYRQILQTHPKQADALHLLGLIAHQTGHHEAAADFIRQAIEVKGDAAAFHNNLGGVYSALQKLPDAVDSYRRALELQPDFADAHSNLGNIYCSQGKLDEALACYRRARELKSGDAEALDNLGQRFQDERRLTEAVDCYRWALELNPNYAEAHNNLGNTYSEQGKLDDAVTCYLRALELKPDNATALTNLGNAYNAQGKFNEAIVCHRRALELKPDYATAHNNLGNSLKDQGKLNDAVACYRRALELKPGVAETHNNLGIALKDLGQFDEAADCYHRAMELKPGYADAQSNLGNIFKEQGELNEALACYRQAREMNRRCIPAIAGMATVLRGKLPEAELRDLENLVQSGDLTAPSRVTLEFGLAQVYDSRGDYSRAAELLDNANRRQREWFEYRGQTYSAAEHHANMTRIIETFTPEYFHRVFGWGHSSKRPVFVVGMPRSGTTLTEQILASHPQVFGAGECYFAALGWERLGPTLGLQRSPIDCLDQVTPEAITQIAEWHLARLEEVAGPGPTRVVDKMPENYQMLGWIATLFPQARIIHCRRDVRDVALSCWATHFDRVRWSNDLSDLADRILDYQRIMAHYESVLPVEIFPVDYEELVADQQGMSRRMLEFVGLEWDPACLDFHQTQRLVRTASVAQVRQPMYRSSVARWKHYQGALAPLLSRLDVPSRD